MPQHPQISCIAIARAGVFAYRSAGFEADFSLEDVGYSPESYRLGLQYYQQVKYQEIFSDIQAA